MSAKAITDHQVLRAAAAKMNGGSTLLRLQLATDQPEKVCEVAIERAISRRLLECGVSPHYAWVEPYGADVLVALDAIDRVVCKLRPGDCLTMHLEFLEPVFPGGIADARRWFEQRGLWLDRAALWMRPLKARGYFLIGRGRGDARPVLATTPAAPG